MRRRSGTCLVVRDSIHPFLRLAVENNLYIHDSQCPSMFTTVPWYIYYWH
jgi:hypothetical protein